MEEKSGKQRRKIKEKDSLTIKMTWFKREIVLVKREMEAKSDKNLHSLILKRRLTNVLSRYLY